MFRNEDKIIKLSPVRCSDYDLTTVAGRDDLADQIENDIDEYSAQAFVDGPRSHLGASSIGHSCDAYLWLKFRWMKQGTISGRKARLFNRGHLEEDRVISLLKGIGFDIKQAEADGKQMRMIDVAGHFGGSCDGQTILPNRYDITTAPEQRAQFLLEIKTSSDRYFGPMKGSGVVKTTPKYWAQMCTYGYKFNLKYALFVCVNKNDDELDIEVLELDHDLGKLLVARAEFIILSSTAPQKIAGHNASFWQCKSCEMNVICHLNERPDKNCRSCQAAQPDENATWRCTFWNNVIPKDFIPQGCDSWTPLAH